MQDNCGYDNSKDGKQFPTDASRRYVTLFDLTYQASEGATFPCTITTKHQVWLDSWVRQFPTSASIPDAMVCVKMIVLFAGTTEQDIRKEAHVQLHSDGSYPDAKQDQRKTLDLSAITLIVDVSGDGLMLRGPEGTCAMLPIFEVNPSMLSSHLCNSMYILVGPKSCALGAVQGVGLLRIRGPLWHSAHRLSCMLVLGDRATDCASK